VSLSAEAVPQEWRPTPRSRGFAIGDEVKLTGQRGGGYRILRFRQEGGRLVVELFGSKKDAGAKMLRTVPVERLRRP
jgi:hypothetical protein